MCVMDLSNFGLSILYSPSDKCQTGSYICSLLSFGFSPVCRVLSCLFIPCWCQGCVSLSESQCVCDFLFYFVTPLSHVNCVQFRFPCLNISDLFPLCSQLPPPPWSSCWVFMVPVSPCPVLGCQFCAPCSKRWLQCRRWKEKVQVHFSSILVALYCKVTILQ